MVFTLNICISYCHIKHEPPYILIAFPALETNAIVLSQLIILVNPTHVLVVGGNR